MEPLEIQLKKKFAQIEREYKVKLHVNFSKKSIKVGIVFPLQWPEIKTFVENSEISKQKKLQATYGGDIVFAFKKIKFSTPLYNSPEHEGDTDSSEDSSQEKSQENFQESIIKSLGFTIKSITKDLSYVKEYVNKKFMPLDDERCLEFTIWLVKLACRAPQSFTKIVKSKLESFVIEQNIDQVLSKLQTEHPHVFDFPSFFTEARKLKRKIIFYAGPTNSGKTYHGLNRLADSQSGYYLAPLRLLALEGQEELWKRAVPTSLITGEERNIVEDATHISATIEMLNTNKKVDKVLIDEIQMIDDISRGWAWSQALIGAPADEIILCGSINALPTIKKIAHLLGEEVEVIKLERHTPLRYQKFTGRLKDVEEQSAVIAFSRKDVLRLKKKFTDLGIPTATIYGSLSPQVRKEQAKLFRAKKLPVLIATDAIAMGLNLPIKHIFFSSIVKYDGKEMRYLTSSEMLQIAGRAGRKGFDTEGFVSLLYQNSEEEYYVSQTIKKALLEPLLDHIWIKPSLEHVLAIGKVLGSDSLYDILSFFLKNIRFNCDWFKTADLIDMLTLAKICDKNLSDLSEKFVFSTAPVSLNSQDCLDSFVKFTENMEKKTVTYLDSYDWITVIRNDRQLLEAEDSTKTLTLYCWLSFRYPAIFPSVYQAVEERNRVDQTILTYLIH